MRDIFDTSDARVVVADEVELRGGRRVWLDVREMEPGVIRFGLFRLNRGIGKEAAICKPVLLRVLPSEEIPEVINLVL